MQISDRGLQDFQPAIGATSFPRSCREAALFLNVLCSASFPASSNGRIFCNFSIKKHFSATFLQNMHSYFTREISALSQTSHFTVGLKPCCWWANSSWQRLCYLGNFDTFIKNTQCLLQLFLHNLFCYFSFQEDQQKLDKHSSYYISRKKITK